MAHGPRDCTQEQGRGWFAQCIKGLGTLHEYELGPTPTLKQQLHEVASTPLPRWKSRLKKHEKMRLLVHATQRDLNTLEEYQQDAFQTIGIGVGQQAPLEAHPCQECGENRTTHQGMRRHYVTKKPRHALGKLACCR